MPAAAELRGGRRGPTAASAGELPGGESATRAAPLGGADGAEHVRDVLDRAGLPELAESIAIGCRRIRRRFSRPATIGVGGQFSSGKSTVLNALLGRPLLPTSDLPQTGVPCWIGRGERDELCIIENDGVHTEPLSTDGIARFSGLVDADGTLRDDIATVRDLVVTLKSGPMPPDAVWVDLPGINESAVATERFWLAADQIDVLVWIVASKQPLSETERRLLARRMETDGPRSVRFVVNAFLRVDTAGSWRQFRQRRAAYHRRRIELLMGVDSTTAAAVPVLSARGSLQTQSGFGAAELRDLVLAVSQREHPDVTGRRRLRAAADVRQLAAAVAARRAEEERRLADLGRAHLDAHRQRSSIERAAFQADVSAELSRLLARVRPVLESCTRAVRWELANLPPRSATCYRSALNGRIEQVIKTFSVDVADAADRCAARNRQTSLSDTGRARLTQLFLPRTPVHQTQRRDHPSAGTTAALPQLDRAISAHGLAFDRSMQPRVSAAIQLIMADCEPLTPSASDASSPALLALRAAERFLGEQLEGLSGEPCPGAPEPSPTVGADLSPAGQPT